VIPWAALFVPTELTPRTLDMLCEMLVLDNVDYLRAHPETPPLYASGVRYEGEEDGGPEEWLSIPHVLELARHGYGSDCKRLAAWRCAELRVGGEGARCVWSAHPEGDKLVLHVRVKRGSGHLEDPSEVLGMRDYYARRAYEKRVAGYYQGAPWNPGPYL
jgi:hypothetical protein